MKNVVAAIIIKDNKILLAQRSLEDKLSLMWEFPGGKVEDGETCEKALVREIREELNIDIECGKHFMDTIHEYGSGTIKLIAYYCRWIDGDIKAAVHNDIKWVKAEELVDFSFAPADIPIAKKLVQEFKTI